MLLQVDIDQVTAIIREVAEAEILPRFRQLAEEDSWEKGPGSVVTVADQAAEDALTKAFQGLIPGSAVVGEEAVEADKAVLEHLLGDETVWIVDPVDGTANFADGSPDFAVMVGLTRAGETLAGWIHDPVENRTVTSEHGAGAWRDGDRLTVGAGGPLDGMAGALGPRLTRHKGFSGQFARTTRSRCCGVDYRRLVTGDLDFAYYRSVKPWDHVAGVLIHAEAGGVTKRIHDLAPYRPGERSPDGILAAPDEETWHAIGDQIPGVLEKVDSHYRARGKTV